jgi:hypothetical protein
LAVFDRLNCFKAKAINFFHSLVYQKGATGETSGEQQNYRQNKLKFFHNDSFLSSECRSTLRCLLASAAAENCQREQNADDDADLDPIIPIGSHGWDVR